jgi:hypothetical protein
MGWLNSGHYAVKQFERTLVIQKVRLELTAKIQ